VHREIREIREGSPPRPEAAGNGVVSPDDESPALGEWLSWSGNATPFTRAGFACATASLFLSDLPDLPVTILILPDLPGLPVIDPFLLDLPDLPVLFIQ
jgi:hypothetical protein